MPFKEKSNWVLLTVLTAAYLIYTVIIFGRAQDIPLADVPYAWPMLGTLIGAIVATILGTIAATIMGTLRAGSAAFNEVGRTDERDDSIYRYGELIGFQAFSAGALVTLGLALAEVEHFWIGNMIYLSFVLSAQIGSVVKIIAYRRGLR